MQKRSRNKVSLPRNKRTHWLIKHKNMRMDYSILSSFSMFSYLRTKSPPFIIIFPFGFYYCIMCEWLDLFEPLHHHTVIVSCVLWKMPLLLLLCSVLQLLPLVDVHISTYHQRSEGNMFNLCCLADWSLMSLLPTSGFFQNWSTHFVYAIIDFSWPQKPEALQKFQIIQNTRVYHRRLVLTLK